MSTRFGDAWTTLDPATHGFKSADDMHTAAQKEGFPDALAMQRNRLLQGANGKAPDTLASQAAKNLPTGGQVTQADGGQVISSKYGVGTNIPNTQIALGNGPDAGAPDKLPKPIAPKGPMLASASKADLGTD